MNMEIMYSVGARIPGGGIGNLAFPAVKALNRKRYIKKIICTSFDKKSLDMSNIKTIPLIEKIPSYYIKDNLFDIIASRRIEKSDFFHGWNNFSLYSMRRARSKGAKTIIERQSAYPTEQQKIIKKEYRKYGIKPGKNRLIKKATKELEESDHVFISSKFILETFLGKKFDKEKIHIIPLGVDTNAFKPIGKEKKNFKVIFVGQISIRKGVHHLLKSFESMPKECELLLIGSVMNDIKNIIKKYEKNESIRIIKYFPDLNYLYNTCSVSVLPSIEDGFGLVVPEAMATGMPVIVSSNVGAKDLVKSGKDGFIVPAGNPEKLKNKILYLYENQKEIRRMGNNARKKAEKYTWEEYGKKLIETYKQISK